MLYSMSSNSTSMQSNVSGCNRHNLCLCRIWAQDGLLGRIQGWTQVCWTYDFFPTRASSFSRHGVQIEFRTSFNETQQFMWRKTHRLTSAISFFECCDCRCGGAAEESNTIFVFIFVHCLLIKYSISKVRIIKIWDRTLNAI